MFNVIFKFKNINTMHNSICKSLIITVLLGMMVLGNANAQSCAEVLKLSAPADKLYNKQSMARSFKMNPSQKIKIVHVFYGSTAYHIDICKPKSLGDFRLKVVDDETGTIFWDNAADDFDSQINISFGTTKRIIIEVEAVNPENFMGQSNCLGLIIKYHREEKVIDKEEEESLELPEIPVF